jgi:hypothetical protein
MDALDKLAADFGITELFQQQLQKAKCAKPRAVTPFEGAMLHDHTVPDPVVDWLLKHDKIHGQDGDWLIMDCPNAGEHTTGDSSARYSPLGMGGEKWRMTRGFKCFHEHCKDVDFLGWVADQGGPSCRRYDPLPWIQDHCVYVEDGRRVCDLNALRRGGRYDLKLEEFGDRYAHIRVAMPTTRDPKRTVSCKTAFLEDTETVKCARYVVRPYVDGEVGCGEVEELNGDKVVNVYRPPVHGVARSDDLATLFTSHVRFLLPDNSDADMFLDWLAFKLQYPRRRSWGVVMVADGAFGIGRSWLGDVVRGVWGERLVKKIDINDLTGTGASAGFNDWASGGQVVVVEEAHDGGNTRQYRAYEYVKTLVDTRPVPMMINRKYGSKNEEIVYFNLLVFTNHADALCIPRDERRLAVFANPRKKREGGYYETLWSAYREDGEALFASVYTMLMARDVLAFEPATAPDTEAKRTMLAVSLGPADVLTDCVIQLCAGDLVTKDMLFDLFREAEEIEHLENTLTNNALRNVVTRLWRTMGSLRPGDKNGVRHRQNDGQKEVRALRNKEHWISVFEWLDKAARQETLREEIANSAKGIVDD